MEALVIDEIQREQGEFSHPEQGVDNRYLKCTLGGRPVLYVHLMISHEDDLALVHLTHASFGAQVLKALRSGLSDVKAFVRGCGAHRLVGITDGTVHNWARLMYLLGLDPIQLPDGRQIVVEEF